MTFLHLRNALFAVAVLALLAACGAASLHEEGSASAASGTGGASSSTSRSSSSAASSGSSSTCAYPDDYCCHADAECGPPYGPHCDTSIGVCGSCATNAGCAGAPDGSACVVGMAEPGVYTACGCAVDADCAQSPLGNACARGGQYRACGCNTTADCPNGAVCPLGGNQVCGPKCTSDAACSQTTAFPYCSSSLGICVACRTDKDCAGNGLGYVYCDAGVGRCVDCLNNDDAQCAKNPSGTRCLVNVCGCASAADCGTSPDGHICVETANWCGCSTTGDCPAGEQCSNGACG